VDENELKQLLTRVKHGDLAVEQALLKLKDLPFKELIDAKIDTHRELRTGCPEVIYCDGKTVNQVRHIVEYMLGRNHNILATRATEAMYDAVAELYPAARYNPLGRVISIQKNALPTTATYIAIVTGGTADLPIAEEAAETALLFGNRVERVVDVGVAGIHRLFAQLELIRGARVVVVIAGMEGALASVVAGLVDKPVIAVPASVGYGANFGGISALLTMLTSCAGGVGVVNIDNGFGAAFLANQINRL